MQDARILFVLTNHDRLGPAGDTSAEQTGFHLSEAAVPWKVLTEAGFEVDIATPAGGKAPIDPGSRDLDDETNRAFLEHFGDKLDDTRSLAVVNIGDYEAIYFPGGHGTMWDLPDSEAVQHAVRQMYETGKIVAAICHGPAALVNVELSDGKFLVDGKTVSAFTDSEEKAAEKDEIVPFLLAEKLEERGATHAKADNFEASVSVDGRLITGQNPASAKGLGTAIRDSVRGLVSEAA